MADNTGEVTIREVDWAQVDARKEGSLDKVVKKGIKNEGKNGKPPAEWIECMHYSPCGKFLGIGSHNNMIYILDVEKNYKEKVVLKGHSSFISSFDWSLDSKWIRSVCGAYELLFFDLNKKKDPRDPSGASNTVEVKWADQSCKLGWHVQGIFPSGCDGSHINSVAMTQNEKLLASGDDYGLVCTYRNPLLEGHESDKYRGHSEFVTHVKWSSDNKMLFSTGG